MGPNSWSNGKGDKCQFKITQGINLLAGSRAPFSLFFNYFYLFLKIIFVYNLSLILMKNLLKRKIYFKRQKKET